MSFEELERVYERLANAVDRAGPEGTPLLLVKLVLVLANRCDDSAFAINAMESCLRNL
jgi:hypothetical protein